MRAFVAVWPPPEAVQGLAGIGRPARPGIRWTTEDQWHVTLRFLGDIDDSEAQGVKASLQQLASVRGMEPVTAVAGPSVEQLGSSILCVPVAGLGQLAAAVAAALLDAGASWTGSSVGGGPVPVGGGGVPDVGASGPGSPAGDRPFRVGGGGVPDVGASGPGSAVGDRPFRGHITIARAARGVPPRLAIPVPFSASWRVDDITLVASTLHPAGARYSVLGRFRL